jgi:hypothetical protein
VPPANNRALWFTVPCALRRGGSQMPWLVYAVGSPLLFGHVTCDSPTMHRFWSDLRLRHSRLSCELTLLVEMCAPPTMGRLDSLALAHC